jgi:hypothetical protein
MIKCTECGYENMDGLDYCDGCGAKLAASEGAPPEVSERIIDDHVTRDAIVAPASAPALTREAIVASEPPVVVEAAPESAIHPEVPAAVVVVAETPPASEAKTGELTPAPAAAPAIAAAQAASAHFKAKLSLLRGGRKGQEFPLDNGQNFIGRWDPETGSFPEVDLEQDDPEAKISRKHALIIIEASKITIEDIGSLNGTYVNRGNRLIPGTPLEIKAGDEVIIGKTFLKLVVDPIS